MPGAVLPATRLPYVEALSTRRFDLGASAELVVAKGYIVALRSAAVSENHHHERVSVGLDALDPFGDCMGPA